MFILFDEKSKVNKTKFTETKDKKYVKQLWKKNPNFLSL